MEIIITSFVIGLIVFAIIFFIKKDSGNEIWDEYKYSNEFFLSNRNIFSKVESTSRFTNPFSTNIFEKTDDELIQYFMEAYDWDEKFIDLVEKELNDRKIDIIELRNKRAIVYTKKENEFEIGKQGNSLYIVLGVILSLTANLFGIVIGYIYKFGYRKSKITNNKYKTYNKQTREFGLIILIIGIVNLILRLLKYFSVL